MALEHLLGVDAAVPAPEAIRRAANLQDVVAEHARSLKDPDGFWAEQARRFRWSVPWSAGAGVERPRPPLVPRGEDQHRRQRTRPARRWPAAEPPGLRQHRRGRHRALHHLRGAAGPRQPAGQRAARALGVGVGDRVIIYMPLTLEGIEAMLAVARLGAVHSVVYAGLGVGALRDRIVDADAQYLIAGDVGFRRGKVVELQGIVDEAVQGLDIRHTVWFQRRSGQRRALREQRDRLPGAGGAQPSRRRPGAGRLRAPAVHPLHLGLHREAEGRGARPRRVHGGHRLPPALLLRPEGRRHLLVHQRHRLGGGPQLHRLRAAAGGHHHRGPRGRGRLPRPGHRLAPGGEAPGERHLHRPHRAADVHEVRRRAAGEVRPLLAAARWPSPASR